MRHTQKGLTAIELLVTISILAIVLAIAVPSMTQFIAKWRVSNAVNALTGSLRLARTEAIARARPVVLCRVDSTAPNTCVSSTGSSGLASGWIVFVNNDLDAKSNFSTGGSDELLLRQQALTGIQDMTPTGSSVGKFIFSANGLGSNNPTGFNIDAMGFDKTSTTPWARKGICITKPGRIRFVTDSADCTTNVDG